MYGCTPWLDFIIKNAIYQDPPLIGSFLSFFLWFKGINFLPWQIKLFWVLLGGKDDLRFLEQAQ